MNTASARSAWSRWMEDDPLFNSGRGAVFSAAGLNELDASIMDGATLNAGAIAGVTRIQHPISLARAVMDHSRHLMFTGDGAETYASNQSCGVSGTGTGEYFIRLTIAREICALVQYEQMSLQEAADEVIQNRLTELGGDGGIVALTPDGQVAWSFNTQAASRAWRSMVTRSSQCQHPTQPN